MASFVGEGLDDWPLFWLGLVLGLPVEVGVVPFLVEDDHWSEVAVAEAEASERDA